MNIAQVITQELGISPQQTESVIRLIDEGNTIPFIARYRKEMTGAMNDEVLRKFDERLRSLRALRCASRMGFDIDPQIARVEFEQKCYLADDQYAIGYNDGLADAIKAIIKLL